MKRIGLSEPVDRETMQEILFANDSTKVERFQKAFPIFLKNNNSIITVIHYFDSYEIEDRYMHDKSQVNCDLDIYLNKNSYIGYTREKSSDILFKIYKNKKTKALVIPVLISTPIPREKYLELTSKRKTKFKRYNDNINIKIIEYSVRHGYKKIKKLSHLNTVCDDKIVIYSTGSKSTEIYPYRAFIEDYEEYKGEYLNMFKSL